LPATNAKRLRKGALLSAEACLRAKADAMKQSIFLLLRESWIASLRSQ